MDVNASPPAGSPTSKRWLVRLLVGLATLVLVPILVCAIPQSSATKVDELMIGPLELDELKTLSWRRPQATVPQVQVPDEADGSSTWEAFETESGKLTGVYGQKVYRIRNGILARGYFHYFAKRRAFEDNFPKSVIDADDGLVLKADEFDAYCVDANGTYANASDECAIWSFWARYGQFVVWITLSNEHISLDEVRFRSLVKRFDELVANSLK